MNQRRDTAQQVRITPDGPALIDGPVEIVLPDGEIVSSDRFTVALCLCGCSATYPWCDTSHRRLPAGRRHRPRGRQS
ncbi:CDGSH iron-sulfur domain-containing protein [Nocardia stercoris]|uniref:CDGSH iron-sulfur domain-containing protein n=1 Tax=Nocardia stercoris TaxID=2483361 RepID=UPI001F2FAA6D|nr:CDGSH iron-sulfur domain-containing protein [Nocardia stercoris]